MPLVCHRPVARKWLMAETVNQHVLPRRNAIGVDDIYGFAGDFTFPVSDAIGEERPSIGSGAATSSTPPTLLMGMPGCAASARLCAMHGAGELSAISAVAGSYAEHLRVFQVPEWRRTIAI